MVKCTKGQVRRLKTALRRKATEARTPDDFCERLAAHVSTPSDRAAFLQTARARLAIKA